MSKGRELSEGKRAQTLLLSGEGLSQVAIAKKLQRSLCAVQMTIERSKDTGQLRSRPGVENETLLIDMIVGYIKRFSQIAVKVLRIYLMHYKPHIMFIYRLERLADDWER